MISQRMPQLREELRQIRYPSRQKGAKIVTLGENQISFPPVFPVKQQKEFKVDGSYDSLIFHHTALRRITRQPWLDLDVVAKYIITYADDQAEEVPVTYGGNLGYWNRRQNAPLVHNFYRHTGYTATYYADNSTDYTRDGEIVTTYIYEYLPKHHAPIQSVRLVEDDAFQAKVLLQKLEGTAHSVG